MITADPARTIAPRPKKADDLSLGLSMSQISHSIGLARIVLIGGLAFVHYGLFPNSAANPFEGIDPGEHQFATWLNSFIVFFFHAAVPLLSLVSGWLFFSFLPQDAWSSIQRRMRGRLTTVYLPMVGWNAFYFALVFGSFCAFPHAAIFARSNRFNIDFFHAGAMDYINAVFGVTATPIGVQFWFVRDLFVTALVSPVWWLLIRRAPWISAWVLGAIWLSGWNMVIFFRSDVPYFFFLGALFHQKHVPVVVSLRLTVMAVSMFASLAALRALAPYLVAFPNHEDPYWLDVATRAMRIFGVIGCWGVIYRLAQTKAGIAVSAYGGVAFFVYSAHWPLLSIIKEILWRLIPGENDFWMLVHMFLSVGVTFGIALGAAMGLARVTPRFFALMNGGRLLGHHKSQRADLVPPVPMQGTAS